MSKGENLRQLLVKDGKRILDGNALPNFAWPAEDLISTALTFAPFSDSEKWRIEAMAEN